MKRFYAASFTEFINFKFGAFITLRLHINFVSGSYVILTLALGANHAHYFSRTLFSHTVVILSEKFTLNKCEGSLGRDSNPRPHSYQECALPAELPRQYMKV